MADNKTPAVPAPVLEAIANAVTCAVTKIVTGAVSEGVAVALRTVIPEIISAVQSREADALKETYMKISQARATKNKILDVSTAAASAIMAVPAYHTVEQEQELCKLAGGGTAVPPPAKRDDEEVLLLVDVERRSQSPADGPPAAIAWLVGAIGEYRVMEVGQYAMAMPKTAKWEEKTAKWWQANVKHKATYVVAPEFAIARFAEMVTRLHATKKRVRICSDAPFSDFCHLSYWMCVYLGSSRIDHTGEGEYRQIFSLTDTANGFRLSKSLPPYDLRNHKALAEAIAGFGFVDHLPLHDVTKMYAKVFIMSNLTPVRGKYDTKNLKDLIKLE